MKITSNILNHISSYPQSLSTSDIINNALDKRHTVTFINPWIFKLHEQHPEYDSVLSGFDSVWVDGILLAKFSSYALKKHIRRLSFDGNSIARSIFESASKSKRQIAFIGGGQNVAKNASALINETYGDIVKYTHHGFFKADQIEVIANEIKSKKIDIIIIGMGGILQDKVSLELKQLIPTASLFTCGGYLDQILNAKNEKYYPDLIESLELRALYRLFKEPKKLWRRYFIDYIPFYKASIYFFIQRKKTL